MASTLAAGGTPVTDIDRVWVRRVTFIASLLTFLALAIALVELVTSAVDGQSVDELLFPLVQPMEFVTALLLTLTGVVIRLLLVGRHRRSAVAHRVGIGLAAATIALATFYLAAYAFRVAASLPTLLRPGPDPSDPFSGIPSSNTAFAIGLLNVGALMLMLRRRWLVVAGQIVITLAATAAGRMMVEYLYGGRRLTSFPFNRGEMAVLSAVCLVALAVAALLSRWDVGIVSALVGTGPGGLVLRASLPALLLLPPVLLGAVQGQQFFDRPRVFATVAVVITVAIILMVMSLAVTLDKRDRQRAIALDRALRARHALSQKAPVVSVLEKRLTTIDRGDVEGIEFASRSQSGEGVLSGDAHALVRLDDRRLGVVLVDVAGHGAGPAITGLRFKDCLTQALRQGASPAASLSSLRPLLYESDEMATAVVADIDIRSGVLRCVIAGHPSPVVFGTDSIHTLEPTGPLLHRTVKGGWDHRVVELEPGDTLLLYTDGLSDLMSEDGVVVDPSSVSRVANDLRSAASIDEMLDWLLNPGRGRRFRDDVTLLILRRSGGLEPVERVPHQAETRAVPSSASRFFFENR